MEPIRIAVIGCGYWGPKLLRNFGALEEYHLAAAVDLVPQRLDYIKKHFRVDRCATNPDEIFDDPTIDAVAIATPISTHADLGSRAIAAGKHVLIEKPMAYTVEQCNHLIEQANAAGKVLLVDHTFLYTGAVQKIREIVDRGDIGDLYYFDSVRVNLGLFQHDYNVIWDLAPHDISIMLHVIEQTPIKVSAVGASPIDLGGKRLESMAYITVYFESGILGHVHVNWLAPVKVRTTLIGGSKKMIVYDDNEWDTKIKIYDRGVEVEDATPESIYKTLVQYRTGDMFAPKLDKTEALRAECIHFAQCIRGQATPRTPATAGRDVVRILAAADYSLRHGGKAVSL